MSGASNYEPVACSLHDELGLRMMRGWPCTLVVDDGERTELWGRKALRPGVRSRFGKFRE